MTHQPVKFHLTDGLHFFDEEIGHPDLMIIRREQVGHDVHQTDPEGDGMQQIGLTKLKAVCHHVSDIKEQAGTCHDPQGARIVDQNGQPKGLCGVKNEVLPELTGGNEYHQQ